MEQLELFQRLGVALAVGLLVGFERGWQERAWAEGSRVAGIRTFGIIGLLGGLWGLVAELVGEIVLGFAFAAFVAVMLVAHIRAMRRAQTYGVTTIVASLVTFALGVIAVRGDIAVTAAGGVIMTLLLGVKPILHDWLTRIDYDEVLAVLKLLVISVVLLPVLPNRGFGPWESLNPFELWLMVVLVSGISFVGYVAVKLAGQKRGILYAGLAGGLVSSTAATVHFARLARKNANNSRLFAAGVVLACATMFPRTILVSWLINPALLLPVGTVLGVATVVAYGAGMLLMRGSSGPTTTPVRFRNPFEFGIALKFGVLLAVVFVLVRGFQAWLGEPGIYPVAVLSGLADVDAITISLARLSAESVSVTAAGLGVVIAAASNTVAKVGLAAVFGGRAIVIPVTLALGASLAAGMVVLLSYTP
ncbi:MAG: MgtC/SapB family protein [Rhodospirillales bacterium]|nr:MgtC/SapB family protein [Rhodospirillales bacterium]